MSNEKSIFLLAAKMGLRFPSPSGELTTEQLFQLPLTSKSGLDLNSIAKTVNARLRQEGEEDFVATASTPAKAKLTLSLDILKAVIADKQADNAAKQDSAAKAARREEIKAILADKQKNSLMSKSEAELIEELKALD